MTMGEPVSALFAKQIMRCPIYSQSSERIPQPSHNALHASHRRWNENKVVEIEATRQTLSRYNNETDWLARDSGGRSRGRQPWQGVARTVVCLCVYNRAYLIAPGRRA